MVLQAVLDDGDWLKTSAIKSQWRAKGKHRADIDFPALVEPVSAYLLNPDKYKLLWAKRWRDPTSHINYKEALVALSTLKRTTRVDSLGSAIKLTLCDNLSVVLAFEKGIGLIHLHLIGFVGYQLAFNLLQMFFGNCDILSRPEMLQILLRDGLRRIG